MLIELNKSFNSYNIADNYKFRGRYKLSTVYGSTIQQVIRKLLLVVFSNNN